VIKWYEGSTSFIDLDEHTSRAGRLAKQGKAEAALVEVISGLHNVHSDERSWQRGALVLYELFKQKGLLEEALSVAWYVNDPSLSAPLLTRVSKTSRARTWAGQAALGVVPENLVKPYYERAAKAYEEEQWLVHAALNYERAGQQQTAQTLWSRLAQQLVNAGDQPYATGLALFNVARSLESLGDAKAAQTATVSSVHHLEAAADHYESIGQRERAFDCYHVLMAVGDLSGLFEHVLEGSLNAIRILREDNLKHHALRLYEHALHLAENANELSAAATLAREMSEYARACGLDRVAEFALHQRARLSKLLASRAQDNGKPPEMVKSALMESLLSYAELGSADQVIGLYQTLQSVARAPEEQQRYARGQERYKNATTRKPPSNESGLGKNHPPPPVWFDDLIEWAEAGSAKERCAGIILDPEGADDHTTRRSALLARLVALAAEQAAPPRTHALEVLAHHLGPIGLYEVLPALETLYESRKPSVRLAAVSALGRHSYKRTFITLQRAVADRNPEVREAAVQEVRRQRFEHAFDPLARIYRDSDYEAARLAALEAMAHLDSVEAHETLLGALDHGTEREASAALKALKRTRSLRFLETARASLPHASARLKDAIQQLTRSR
jgi:HEAT repeat protein